MSARWLQDDVDAFAERCKAWEENGHVRTHKIKDDACPRPRRPQKYGNKPTGGFASIRESDRHQALSLLEKAGAIYDLKTQVRFPLKVKGLLVCTYVADFTYIEDGVFVVEDSKGYRTREFRLKAKLFQALHGYEVRLT